MGETGGSPAANPRRWVAVVAALLLVGAAGLQFGLLRSQCKGSLRYWGFCNECGERTRNRVRYGAVGPGPKRETFRYFCEPCVQAAPAQIRAKKHESEDWSLAIRVGIQSVLLCVMALGFGMVRWSAPVPVTIGRDAVALSAGPVHMALAVGGMAGSWLPLVAAGAVCVLSLAVAESGRGRVGP